MEINVLIEGVFEGCPTKDWLRKEAEKVLAAEGVQDAVELSLVITTQEKIQELNKTYRGKDKPTDVLAFYLESGKDSSFISPPDNVRRLGDVIISFPQAVTQAKEHQHSIKKELTILIIHGILHLLGYDHENRADKGKMRAREEAILAELTGMIDAR